jgi:hypothetical protein
MADADERLFHGDVSSGPDVRDERDERSKTSPTDR